MAKAAIILIKFYRYFSRNLLGHNIPLFIVPPQCKFYPSCSEYAIESINKYGFWTGSLKGIIRILRCNPLTTSGLKPKA